MLPLGIARILAPLTLSTDRGVLCLGIVFLVAPVRSSSYIICVDSDVRNAGLQCAVPFENVERLAKLPLHLRNRLGEIG